MPWMLLVLTMIGALSPSLPAALPTALASARSTLESPPRLAGPVPRPAAPCPVSVTARRAPLRPYPAASAVATPIPTGVDAQNCPIPLAVIRAARP